jgi:CHASE2 domain-containing sensor protein
MLASPWGEFLSVWSYDLLNILRPPPLPVDAVVLYMDEASYAKLKQLPQEPWDRALHARLARQLKRSGARLIAFDILFDSRWPVAGVDEDFAKALADHGRVVLAAALTFSGATGQPEVARTHLPNETLRNAGKFGMTELPIGPDGAIRCLIQVSDQPSFAQAAARLFDGSEPARLPLWIRFYGSAYTLPHASYYQALEADALPRDFFRGKAVFVGRAPIITPEGSKNTDRHRTPFSRWSGEEMSGVEVQATIFANLVEGDYARRAEPGVEFAGVALLGLFAGFAGAGLWAAVAAIGLGTLAVAAAAFVMKDAWFAWLIFPFVQAPAAIASATLLHLRFLQREKRVLEQKIEERLAPAPILLPSDDLETPRPQPASAPAGLPAIPDHTLIRRIGEGAYGEVWLARGIIGTYHAVKIVFRRRFSGPEPYEREFRGVKMFTPISRSHPGLIQILHVGRNEAGTCFFCIMELSDDEEQGQKIDEANYSAKSLSRVLAQRRRLSVVETVNLGIELSATLDYLHRQKLLHRDVKPSNILFVDGTAKLADVGLVTEIREAKRGEATYLGTEGYIPPEGPGTVVADVFSLGKVLYEASMGLDRTQFPELPDSIIDRSDAQALMLLNEVLVKACHPDAKLRYQAALELHHALVQIQQQIVPCPLQTNAN